MTATDTANAANAKKAKLLLDDATFATEGDGRKYRGDGGPPTFGLTYDQLEGWATAQPKGSIVGYTARAENCPCNRCILDLGLATVREGAHLEVYSDSIQVVESDTSLALIRAATSAWLSQVVADVDQLGVVANGNNTSVSRKPVMREQLLAILHSNAVMTLAGKQPKND